MHLQVNEKSICKYFDNNDKVYMTVRNKFIPKFEDKNICKIR